MFFICTAQFFHTSTLYYVEKKPIYYDAVFNTKMYQEISNENSKNVITNENVLYPDFILIFSGRGNFSIVGKLSDLGLGFF